MTVERTVMTGKWDGDDNTGDSHDILETAVTTSDNQLFTSVN